MSEPSESRKPVSLTAFHLRWAQRQGWAVPSFHFRILDWLENERAPVRVLMAFRGAAKSTLFGSYKAHALRADASSVHQVWAADDKLARKMARYVRYVLLSHPWCAGMLDPRAPETGFFVGGATDLRNPSMDANAILSNATGSRATAIDFDDIEVPKNIGTAPLREKLRERITEAAHILVPGGQKTYIGTPHTHESIYTEQIEGGAAVLKIPLFGASRRFEKTDSARRYRFDFKPGADGLYVILGIGKYARLLNEGRDYRVEGNEVVFAQPPRMVLDIAAHCAWPERFTRTDIEVRRKECRTLNSWDSQYQLEAKPVRETRLDPDRMVEYDVEPVAGTANRVPILTLGRVRLAGFKAWWDCSLGKVTSDASALCVFYTDDAGNLYWHRAVGVTGDLEELDARGRLVGGQCRQVLEVLKACHAHHVTVETNGPGGFVPAILRKHAKAYGVTVSEHFSTENKQKRILDAFEAPLSSGFLWAHSSVARGPAAKQMREFDPMLKTQADDYLDAGGRCIAATPIRLARIAGIPAGQDPQHWTPSSGVHDVEVEFDR